MGVSRGQCHGLGTPAWVMGPVGRAWAGVDPQDNGFSRGHRGAAGGHKALHQHSWIHSEHLSVLSDSTLLLILGAVFAFVRLFW